MEDFEQRDSRQRRRLFCDLLYPSSPHPRPRRPAPRLEYGPSMSVRLGPHVLKHGFIRTTQNFQRGSDTVRQTKDPRSAELRRRARLTRGYEAGTPHASSKKYIIRRNRILMSRCYNMVSWSALAGRIRIGAGGRQIQMVLARQRIASCVSGKAQHDRFIEAWRHEKRHMERVKTDRSSCDR